MYTLQVYKISFLKLLDLLGVLGVEDNPMYAYIDTYNFFLSTVNTAGGIMFGVTYNRFFIAKNNCKIATKGI